MTTNINRDAQLSTIANAAYLDKPPQSIAIGGVTWERVAQSNSTTSGFYGVAYRNPQTNEIAVAYRGTDGMSDLKADTTFANGGWNQQFTDAASSNWGQFKPPSNFDFSPIGAFYDSQSAAFDNAASIANKTTRAMNASGQALSAQQMAALDANNDGQISTVEAAGMRLWADLNENGTLDNAELQSVGSAIQSADYSFYTQGNGLAAASGASGTAAPGVISVSAAGNRPAPALPAAPGYGGVPASNYRTQQATDNTMRPEVSANLPIWKEAA